jgi:hypothetical protein
MYVRNYELPLISINLKSKIMKTLNFDIFDLFQLTNEEMISVRGGTEGDPTPTPPPLPIRI